MADLAMEEDSAWLELAAIVTVFGAVQECNVALGVAVIVTVLTERVESVEDKECGALVDASVD